MRDKLLALIKTKDQQAVNLETLFLHFDVEPPTKEEIYKLIESRKAVEFKGQPKTEDTQSMYWRRMNEADDFQTKAGYAALIKNYGVKGLMTDLYLTER